MPLFTEFQCIGLVQPHYNYIKAGGDSHPHLRCRYTNEVFMYLSLVIVNDGHFKRPQLFTTLANNKVRL